MFVRFLGQASLIEHGEKRGKVYVGISDVNFQRN